MILRLITITESSGSDEKNTIMKRYIATLVCFIALLPAWADVVFKFAANTVDAECDKAAMESNISALLTEIQSAGEAGRDLDLTGIGMEEEACSRLNALWSGVRFTCDKSVYISKCLYDTQGVQVRGLFITMHPVDDTYTQSINRELTISLNRNGVITGVRPAMELQEDVSKIMSEGEAVTDLRQRRELLKFVEDLRCYYNERNIDALEKIYSDNALIITGSVIRKGHKGSEATILNGSQVKYNVSSKKEYLDKLSGIFRNNARLEVSFDRISVSRNGSKPDLYGVTLHQKWNSSSYSDEGWLFLYWDLSDPDQPKIMIRTWQEDKLAEEQGVFNLNDFFIP